MVSHEDYVDGFINGFNAALKSDYIKELYQTQEKEKYLKKIKELENQLNTIKTLIYSINGGYQMYNIQQRVLTQNEALINLMNMINYIDY